MPWGCLHNQNAQLREKLTAAEAVVAKLPKTADGVSATPGMDLFVPCTYRDGFKVELAVVHRIHGTLNGGHIELAMCYSTREAAAKAKEGA